jgi:hypothetical protein
VLFTRRRTPGPRSENATTWRQEILASMYGMNASTKPREADGGTSAKASWKDSQATTATLSDIADISGKAPLTLVAGVRKFAGGEDTLGGEG